MIRTALVALLAALLAAPVAVAHKANPNYLSEVAGLSPAIEGVRLEMVNRDDRILLDNRSDRDIVVMGYDDEPYARIKADGSVEVNTNSKAYYLNEDRFAATKVPESLPTEPAWKRLSGSHRFEWHDHRAHFMGKGRPPSVKNPDERQKVFDWEVPLEAGGRPARITGTLYWTPLPSETPTGAIVGGALIVLASIVAAVVVRRRRAPAGGAMGTERSQEVW